MNKEKVLFYVMFTISALFYGIGLPLLAKSSVFKVIMPVLGIYAALIVYALFVGLISMAGRLRGSAVRVDEHQFPEVYAIVKQHAYALGMQTVPYVYVAQQGGMLNAFATRILRRNHVVILSSLFDLAYQDSKEALSFIIAHELGHLKLNHVSILKYIATLPARLCVPFIGSAYSRACEYNADTVGLSLCPEGAVNGFLILSIGKSLYKKVDVAHALQNFKNDAGFVTSFAEFFSTHPLVFNRINRAYELQNKLNHDSSEKPFVSPLVQDHNKQKHL